MTMYDKTHKSSARKWHLHEKREYERLSSKGSLREKTLKKKV
jgi:hypothetical protein